MLQRLSRNLRQLHQLDDNPAGGVTRCRAQRYQVPSLHDHPWPAPTLYQLLITRKAVNVSGGVPCCSVMTLARACNLASACACSGQPGTAPGIISGSAG
jgi:hypothetical protein